MKALTALAPELEGAKKRRDYLAQHPDLGRPATSTTTSTGDNA